ncbi:hypothetical protein NDU88_005067 [Pleurodeles waltl]|uniref:Uncharacterized protein n=1 Tax=Pleurodeles waltl TaxID=8319 RepID=A0AAV7VKP4_PLEWA|nr:hypothetical protein NDU88_005067 [Pleurodeles waltl]
MRGVPTAGHHTIGDKVGLPCLVAATPQRAAPTSLGPRPTCTARRVHIRAPTTTCRLHRQPGLPHQMPVLTAGKELWENAARTARRPRSLPASCPLQGKKKRRTQEERSAHCPVAAIASRQLPQQPA